MEENETSIYHTLNMAGLFKRGNKLLFASLLELPEATNLLKRLGTDPKTPPSLRKKLFEKGNDEVKTMTLAASTIAEEDVIATIRSSPLEVIEKMAEVWPFTTKALDAFKAEFKNQFVDIFNVLKNIVEHADAKLPVIKKAISVAEASSEFHRTSNDNYARLLITVAESPKVKGDSLSELYKSFNSFLGKEGYRNYQSTRVYKLMETVLAKRKDCPPAIFRILCSSAEIEVRMTCAQNPLLFTIRNGKRLQERLWNDKSVGGFLDKVQPWQKMLENPLCTEQYLLELASMKGYGAMAYKQQAIIVERKFNPKVISVAAQKRILKKLSVSTIDEDVRRQASERLKKIS